MTPAVRPSPGGRTPASFERARRDLDHIRDVCRAERHRNGFFAAMYGRVTAAVEARARAGRFTDPDGMEAFVGRFAARYVEAFWARAAGQPTTASWRVAFDAAETDAPLVVQHLALGMNAHINLDLGIVTAEAADANGTVEHLRRDFLAINDVLAELVDRCQAAVVASSPVLAVVDDLLDSHDESATRFSLRLARSGAWDFAERLAGSPASERASLIERRDQAVASVGRRLLTRAGPIDTVQRLVRAGEWRSVESVIDTLTSVDVD